MTTERPADGGAAPTRPRRLLFADHEPRLALRVREAFTAAGWLVEVATTGEDAYRLASDGVHDVVVLDDLEGALDALAVAKRLRVERPGVPILLFSSRREAIPWAPVSAAEREQLDDERIAHLVDVSGALFDHRAVRAGVN